jgi:hypothetical protein
VERQQVVSYHALDRQVNVYNNLTELAAHQNQNSALQVHILHFFKAFHNKKKGKIKINYL